MCLSRLFQRTLLATMVAGAANSALAFSLLGPFDTWQVDRIGYNPLNADIGGPMNLAEEYRWNTKIITYGFDESFLNYFGQRGTNEISKAIAILNNLPAFSRMSANLTEFSTDTKRVNYRASAVNLYDLKSTVLSYLLEEMGLASPERYTWTLRERRDFAPPVRYLVIKRNFDPVTLAPSSYVNGVLYTYYIGEFVTSSGTEYADAVEVQVDPLAFGFTAVVTTADGFYGRRSLEYGSFYTGLTRDDVGSLRYLYRPTNFNMENLIPGSTGSGRGGTGSPWSPVGGGGAGGTNNTGVDLALRPGVDRILFKPAKYESVFGSFITVTNQYTDTYITNSHRTTQTIRRVLTQPDILFSAEDLGQDAGGFPIPNRRTIAASPIWINNDALNGQATLAGPGQIQPQVVITFNKVGPFIINQNPSFLDEGNPAFPGFSWVWGSFDGTTNAPFVYPVGSTIEDLERQVLGGR